MVKELDALINLLDDPDEEVYTVVADKLCSYGKAIIPDLERYWETTPTETLQERIELLIHRLQFSELKESFTLWAKEDYPELLFGAHLLSKYLFPDNDYTVVSTEVEKIRRNIWLELNSYLTPLERINIINNIVFKFHKYSGVEISYQKSQDFLISKLIESKKGNSFSLVILYATLCQLLDVPVFAVKFPKQLVLAYFDPNTNYNVKEENNFYKIKFFIDPVFGNVISHNDVELFFKRLNVPPTASYFRPLTNLKVIQNIIIEYTKCYNELEHKQHLEELEELIKILDK